MSYESNVTCRTDLTRGDHLGPRNRGEVGTRLPQEHATETGAFQPTRPPHRVSPGSQNDPPTAFQR